jgi:hypothetical protein
MKLKVDVRTPSVRSHAVAEPVWLPTLVDSGSESALTTVMMDLRSRQIQGGVQRTAH